MRPYVAVSEIAADAQGEDALRAAFADRLGAVTRGTGSWAWSSWPTAGIRGAT